jgi:CheY-like chemotaxis protein
MTLRVLFADDQLPSPVDADNERPRHEIRRELGNRPGIKDIDAVFDADFEWFVGLLDYLEKSKHVHVTRVASFAEACSRIERPEEFDLAVVDLSWWGDATLPPGRQHRHNRGLELIDRLAKRRRDGRQSVPVIALSQNFRDDFELMSTVLDMDALPVPKFYDKLGYRALYSAIQHLARLSPAEEPAGAASRTKLFISHAHADADTPGS